MLFFMGLGHKLRNFPFVTVLMIIICCGYYFGAQDQKLISKKIHNLSIEILNSNSRINLYAEYIKSIGGDFKKVKIKEFLDKQYNSKKASLVESKKDQNDKVLNDEEQKNKQFTLEVVSKVEDYKFIENKYPVFLKLLKSKSKDIIKLRSYSEHVNELKKIQEKRIELFRDNHLLNFHTIGVLSTLKAMFSHGNVAHLVGNMLFLFVFGIFVEQRLGHLAYGAMYIVLGGAALIGFSLSMGSDSQIYILGASANVSAIMGVFFLAFIHFKIRVYAWYFFMGKTVWLSIKKYFLPIFILQDFIMSFAGDSGVAHLAHLYGFIFGVVFLILWNKKNYIPAGFRYPFEYELWKKNRALSDSDITSDEKRFFKVGRDLLKYNPDNWNIKSDLRNHIFKKLSVDSSCSREVHGILVTLVPEFVQKYVYSPSKPFEFFKFMNVLDNKLMDKYLDGISQKQLIFIIDQAIEFEQFEQATIYIHCYFLKYPTSKKLLGLGKTLDSILASFSQNDSIQDLISYLGKDAKSMTFNEVIFKYINLKETYGDEEWQKSAN